MGNECQRMLESLPVVADHCFMYVNAEEGIVFANFPATLLESIKNAYRAKFNKPFKSEEPLAHNILLLKPHKHLFEKYASKPQLGLEITCLILELVERHGFCVASSCRLTIEHGVASWFFVRDARLAAAPPPPPHHPPLPAAIGFGFEKTAMSSGTIAAIGPECDSDVRFVNIEEAFLQHLVKTIESFWPGEVVELKPDNRLVVKGSPWVTSGNASKNDARLTLLHLIMHMRQNNFALHTCINVRERDHDQLFFRSNHRHDQHDQQGQPPQHTQSPPRLNLTAYMALRLSGCDKFYVLSPSLPNMVEVLSGIVRKYWSEGVCEVGQEEGHDWLTVNGSLWNLHGTDELANRLLLTQIFQELAVIGWFPVDSMTPSRSISELSTIIFQNLPAARMQYFCVCPLSPDKLCVVNAPPETLAEIRVILKQTLLASPIEESSYEQGVRFTVPGNPIRGTQLPDTVLFNYLLMMIMAALHNKQRWTIGPNVDASNYTKETSNEDDRAWRANSIWFFRPYDG